MNVGWDMLGLNLPTVVTRTLYLIQPCRRQTADLPSVLAHSESVAPSEEPHDDL